MGDCHGEPAAEAELAGHQPCLAVFAAVVRALLGRHAGADAEADIAELAAVAGRRLDAVMAHRLGVDPAVALVAGRRHVGRADREAAELRRDVGQLVAVAGVQASVLKRAEAAGNAPDPVVGVEVQRIADAGRPRTAEPGEHLDPRAAGAAHDDLAERARDRQEVLVVPVTRNRAAALGLRLEFPAGMDLHAVVERGPAVEVDFAVGLDVDRRGVHGNVFAVHLVGLVENPADDRIVVAVDADAGLRHFHLVGCRRAARDKHRRSDKGRTGQKLSLHREYPCKVTDRHVAAVAGCARAASHRSGTSSTRIRFEAQPGGGHFWGRLLHRCNNLACGAHDSVPIRHGAVFPGPRCRRFPPAGGCETGRRPPNHARWRRASRIRGTARARIVFDGPAWKRDAGAVDLQGHVRSPAAGPRRIRTPEHRSIHFVRTPSRPFDRNFGMTRS